MQTVFNIADQLKREYDFFIVTRDCAGKSDQTPFIHAARDKWNARPEADIYYASPAKMNSRTFGSLIKEVSPNFIYLNSVFSYVCVKFLFARRRARLRDIPLIVAPSGEFSPEALRLKSAKKQPFLTMARMAQLFEQVVWKAANEAEKADILNVVGPGQPIFITAELVPNEILKGSTLFLSS